MTLPPSEGTEVSPWIVGCVIRWSIFLCRSVIFFIPEMLAGPRKGIILRGI